MIGVEIISDISMRVYNKCPRFIQTWGINLVEIREWLINHSSSVNGYLNLLKQSQNWKDEDFLEYQNSRLRQIVMFADREIPFYRRFYKEHHIDASSIRTIEDLEKLPIISKRDVISNWDDLIPLKKMRSELSYTSGTTGTPLKIRVSKDCISVNRASSILRNSWAGHNGELVARFVGDRPVANCSDRRLYRRSYVMHRLFFPSYCISIHTFQEILDSLAKHKVQYLQCYPSTAFILAKFLQGRDEYFPLKAMLFSSEPMYVFQRDLIEERFQTKTFGFYGQAEKVISASECEKGNYHLAMIDGVLEVVQGEERAKPGERGFAIATTLCNFAMPLIRYRLDDYTGIREEKCECGRNSPIIFPIEAKSDDLVITPDGNIISPSSLTFPFKHVQHIIESQIVQKSLDQIIIRIVPSENFSSHDESMLMEAFNDYLGEGMSIRIERVSSIHHSGSFKKRFVISELTGDIFERAKREGKTI
jgi:phenylacetate-CoA ligase